MRTVLLVMALMVVQPTPGSASFRPARKQLHKPATPPPAAPRTTAPNGKAPAHSLAQRTRQRDDASRGANKPPAKSSARRRLGVFTGFVAFVSGLGGGFGLATGALDFTSGAIMVGIGAVASGIAAVLIKGPETGLVDPHDYGPRSRF